MLSLLSAVPSLRSPIRLPEVMTNALVFPQQILPNSAAQFVKFREIPRHYYPQIPYIPQPVGVYNVTGLYYLVCFCNYSSYFYYFYNNGFVQKPTQRSFHGLVRRADDRKRWPQFSTWPSYKLISQHRARHGRHGPAGATIQRRRRGWRHSDVTGGVLGGRDGRRMTSHRQRRQWRLMLRLSQQQITLSISAVVRRAINIIIIIIIIIIWTFLVPLWIIDRQSAGSLILGVR